jgi:hypothetical protein
MSKGKTTTKETALQASVGTEVVPTTLIQARTDDAFALEALVAVASALTPQGVSISLKGSTIVIETSNEADLIDALKKAEDAAFPYLAGIELTEAQKLDVAQDCKSVALAKSFCGPDATTATLKKLAKHDDKDVASLAKTMLEMRKNASEQEEEEEPADKPIND